MTRKRSVKRSAPGRLKFPEEETKFSWLPLLLDAYAIVDKGIATAVHKHQAKRKVTLACKEGCDACCRTNRDIPVYSLELVGVYWFASEKVGRPRRDILREQLSSHRREDPCPFLIDRSCTIYPVRPIACRQFNVFDKLCSEGDDPYFSRRQDVLVPIRKYTNRAFYIMLPFYGVTGEADKIEATINRIIETQASNLQSFPWQKLVKRMDDFASHSTP